MKAILLPTLLLNFLIICAPAVADDMRQYLGDQIEEKDSYIKDIETEESDPYLPESVSDEAVKKIDKKNKLTPSEYVAEEGYIKSDELKETVTPHESLIDPGYQALGSNENRPQLLEASYDEIFKGFQKAGKKALSLSYYGDSYNYTDETGTFQRTFRDSPKNFNSGYLIVGLEQFIYRSFVDISWGANLGVSNHRGQGMFVDGTESNMFFNLWMLPADLYLGFGFTLTKWFKISGSAGPSAMGLLQSRSDKADAEKRKRRRQVSYGQFVEGSFKIAVSELFRSGTHKMYSQYGLTKYYLNLQVRYHSYQNFQEDDFGVGGLAYGAGLTFEFI